MKGFPPQFLPTLALLSVRRPPFAWRSILAASQLTLRGSRTVAAAAASFVVTLVLEALPSLLAPPLSLSLLRPHNSNIARRN